MRSQIQALIVIAVAFGALVTILATAASGEWGINCGCQAPVGFPPTCPVGPCPAHEMLAMESYKINSPTNATLMIMNTSPMNMGLAYYTVSQSNGAQFTHNNATEPIVPNLPPGQVVNAQILIAGASFTFQPGTSYTVTIVTMRNNEFQFTIKA